MILDHVFYREILDEHFVPSDGNDLLALISFLSMFRELGRFYLLLAYLTTLSVAQICGRTKQSEYMFDAYNVFATENVNRIYLKMNLSPS
jgi:hypothetical protein